MSRDAVKFGRMSKKQREKVEDEVRYHRERQLVSSNNANRVSNGSSVPGLTIGLGPGSMPVISSSTGSHLHHSSADHHLNNHVSDPSPDSSVYDPNPQSQNPNQQPQPSSSQQQQPQLTGYSGSGNGGVNGNNSTSFGPYGSLSGGGGHESKWSTDVGNNGPSNGGYSPYPPLTPYDVVSGRGGSDFVDSTTFDGSTSVSSMSGGQLHGHHLGGHHGIIGPSGHLVPIGSSTTPSSLHHSSSHHLPLDTSPDGGHLVLDRDYDLENCQMHLVNVVTSAHKSTCTPLEEISEMMRRPKVDEEIELDLDNFKNMVIIISYISYIQTVSLT